MIIKIHIVQQEETLELILKKYHVTKQTIIMLNPHIKSIDNLQSGMKIKIPSSVKPFREYKNIPREKHKVNSPRKSQYANNSLFYRYAHVHRRPIGEMKYDQQSNINNKWTKQSMNQQSMNEIKFCSTCHQPVY